MNDGRLVQVQQDGPVARIVLSRLQARNALNLELCRDLRAAAEHCARDPSIRSVLLEATGPAFCVGGDLVEFEAKGASRPAHLAEAAREFHAAQALLMTMRAPVVVAVQGAAAGAGMTLALVGDLVLAAESAHFTMGYTAIGLSADGGSTYLLPRLIGLRRAQELIFTNRRLSATEAADWGLVTTVVRDEDLRDRATDLAARLAKGPADAHQVIKGLLFATYGRDFVGQTDIEGAEIARLSGGSDAAEGIAAFHAKRKAVFR